MLELDFNKIQFCGRQEELLKLQLAFDQARRNTDSKSSSSSSQPQRRGGQRQQQAPSLKQIQEQEDGIFNQALRESDEEDQQKSEVEQKVVDDEGGPDDPAQPKLPIVLISGASGTGKTALVEHFLQQQKDKIQRQLQKKMQQQQKHKPCRPLLVGRGKFEEESQRQPYSATMDCFNGLLDELDQQSLEMKVEWYESFLPKLDKYSSDLPPDDNGDGDDHATKDGHRSGITEEEHIRNDIKKLSKSDILPKLKLIFEAAAEAASAAGTNSVGDPSQPSNKRMSYESSITAGASGMLSKGTKRGSYGTNDDDWHDSTSSCDMTANKATTTTLKAGKGGINLYSRYKMMFQSFVKSLCNVFTVVIVMDDLQWADPHSLKLLKSLLSSDKALYMPNKLFIGTYRTTTTTTESSTASSNGGNKNEKHSTQPSHCFDPSMLFAIDEDKQALYSTFSSSRRKRSKRRGWKVKQAARDEQQHSESGNDTSNADNMTEVCMTLIELNNFDCSMVATVIANLLGRDISAGTLDVSTNVEAKHDEIVALAKVVHHRTDGSIFFVIQYLRLLYDRKYITYNLSTLKWECTLESIDRITLETDHIMDDTVVNMLCDKIVNLSSRHSSVLQVFITMAAFVGLTHFDSHLIYQMIQCFKKIHGEGKGTKLTIISGEVAEQSGAVPEATDADRIAQTLFSIKSQDDVHDMLDIAVKEGLLERLVHQNRRYKFAHDRVREAAMSLAPRFLDRNQTIETAHLDAGRIFYDIYCHATRDDGQNSDIEPGGGEIYDGDLGGEDTDRLLLLAVRHLNEGIEYITDENELMELAKSNVLAGKYCIARTAFQAALEFLFVALNILSDRDQTIQKNLIDIESNNLNVVMKPRCRWWDDSNYYELVLELHTKLGYVLFCCSRHDEAEAVIKQVLKHGKSLQDKLSSYYTLIESLATQGKFRESINVNLNVLDQLGIHIPRRFLKFHLLRNYMGLLKRLCRISSAEDLLDSFFKAESETGGEEAKNLFEMARFCGMLLDNSGLSGNIDMQYLALFECIKAMLDHRVQEMSVMTVMSVGFLHGINGNMKQAYHHGKVAAAKAKEFTRGGQTYCDMDGILLAYLYGGLISWGEPYHNCLNPMLDSYKLSLDRGQLDMLTFPILGYSAAYFQCGLRLGPLKKDLLRFVEMLLDYGQIENLQVLRSTVELVLKLTGDTVAESIISDESLYSSRSSSETNYLTEPDRNNNLAFQNFCRHQMILSYYMGDVDLANEMMSKLCLPSDEGPMIYMPQRFFFEALVCFAMWKLKGSRSWWHRIRGHRLYKKLEKLHLQGNVNCHHMVLILHAELMSIRERKNDDPSVVQAAYDKAITVSGKRGFLHDQALCNELAGLYFWKERNDLSWAITYLTRSHDLYSRWGAISKVHQMEETYGEEILGSNIHNGSTAQTGGSGYKARSRLEEITPSSRNSIVNMSFNKNSSTHSGGHQGNNSAVSAIPSSS